MMNAPEPDNKALIDRINKLEDALKYIITQTDYEEVMATAHQALENKD